MQRERQRGIVLCEFAVDVNQKVAAQRDEDRAEEVTVRRDARGQRVDDIRVLHAAAFGQGDVKLRTRVARCDEVFAIADRYVGHGQEAAAQDELAACVEHGERRDLRMAFDELLQSVVQFGLAAGDVLGVPIAERFLDARYQFAVDTENHIGFFIEHAHEPLQRLAGFDQRAFI